MADIAYCLPAGIQFAQGSSIGFTRQGVDRSGGVGPFKSRGWQDFNLRQYSIEINPFKHNGTLYEEFMAFWDQIADNGYIGYVMEPVSATHRNLPCGPLGDGVKTTFPIPVYNPSDVLIMVDGVIPASGYTLHQVANLITTDAYALMSSTGDWATGGVTDSIASFGLVGNTCLKLTYNSAANPEVIHWWQQPRLTPITDGRTYTNILSVLETAVSPRSFRISWRLHDSAGTYLTTTNNSTYYPAVTGQWTTYADTKLITHASGAAYSQVHFRGQTIVTDPFYCAAAAVCPGDYDRWHLPSQAPGLVEFDTAPADGARVSVVATGKRVTRCRFTGQPGWQYAEPGHIRMGRITATEIVEY